MIEFEILNGLAGIRHGSTEIGDAEPTGVVRGEQIHKDKAAWVTNTDALVVPRVDALATRKKEITLSVWTADCVPLLFADVKQGIVGTIHAGWRGTALEITRKTIQFLGIQPFHLRIGLGPAICPNHFEVGEEVARQFDDSVVRESETNDGKYFVDLWQANVNQCIELGIPEKNIQVIRRCTVEDPKLYSFWRGDHDKRNVTWIRRDA